MSDKKNKATEAARRKGAKGAARASEATPRNGAACTSAAAPARAKQRRAPGGRMSAVGSTRVKDRSRLSSKMRRSDRVRLWLSSLAPDFVMVLLVSAALTFTVSFAFNSAWAYRGNVALIVALTVPLLLALYAGTWSKRALVPSAAATVVIALVIIGGAVATSPEPLIAGGMVNDAEGSYGIFAITLVVVSVVTFLLSRRPAGLVFLLIGSVIACGAVQFLYREWVVEQPGIPAFLAMLFGVVMLFTYESYKQSVYSADRVKKTSFAGAFSFAALVAAVCVLVGTGVFYGAVTGFDVTTPEIKPFESYVSPPVDESGDDYQTMQATGDETSDITDEDMAETNESGEGDSQQDQGTFLGDTVMADIARALVGYSSVDESDVEIANYMISQVTGIITAVFAVLAVVAVILLQRARRALRLRLIAKKSNGYQVWYLYTWLLGRFRRLKLRKPQHLTPMEYAVGASRAMKSFTRGTGGVDFVEVSGLYQDVAFGGHNPTDEELERVKRYYRCFFRNARMRVGWPKWLIWKYWRI